MPKKSKAVATQPKLDLKPASPPIPKVISRQFEEFRAICMELELVDHTTTASGHLITVKAPAYGDAHMLEQVLSSGAAFYKRMTVDGENVHIEL